MRALFLLWEETHVLKYVGLNPSTLYWIDMFVVQFVMFAWKRPKITKKAGDGIFKIKVWDDWIAQFPTPCLKRNLTVAFPGSTSIDVKYLSVKLKGDWIEHKVEAQDLKDVKGIWLKPGSHTSCRLQRLLQRARLLQIIGNFSIFTAMDRNSCWSQQIGSYSERASNIIKKNWHAIQLVFLPPRSHWRGSGWCTVVLLLHDL